MYEKKLARIETVHAALLDQQHIFTLGGERRLLDLSTQSQVMNKLVLIVDVPECVVPLDVPPLRMRLPQTLWATVAEEEIEEGSPGQEQERDSDWIAAPSHFHGFTARLPSGSVFMGPFALSDKLVSQYVSHSIAVSRLQSAHRGSGGDGGPFESVSTTSGTSLLSSSARREATSSVTAMFHALTVSTPLRFFEHLLLGTAAPAPGVTATSLPPVILFDAEMLANSSAVMRVSLNCMCVVLEQSDIH